jgi:hypothetical protein
LPEYQLPLPWKRSCLRLSVAGPLTATVVSPMVSNSQDEAVGRGGLPEILLYLVHLAEEVVCSLELAGAALEAKAIRKDGNDSLEMMPARSLANLPICEGELSCGPHTEDRWSVRILQVEHQ